MAKRQKKISFRSNILLNGVIIIDGLRSSDYQTALRLRENLVDMRFHDQFYLRYFKVGGRTELEDVLKSISDLATNQGLKPIIHFELHGDKDVGIVIGEAEEIVSWAILEGHLRKINIACSNNLGVVMAACYGLHLIGPININEPCPFYFLIGPENPVTSGEIEDFILPFYKKLFNSDDLSAAFATLGNKFQQFLAEKFFAVTFARYLQSDACRGNGARVRLERLVSKAMAEKPRNAENLKKTRAFFKQQLRSTKPQFDKRASVFLHGRIEHFDYESFKRFVLSEQNAQKRYVQRR